MSKSSDADFNLDLHFLPAWAREPSTTNRYADYEGEAERRGRRGREGRGRGAGRRDRTDGSRGQGRAGGAGQARSGQPAGARERGERRGRGRDKGRPPREQVPLPEINVAFVPDEAGVDSLTRQIRMTGRAYPLFEIARLILAKPERLTVTLSVRKDKEGKVTQPLYHCAIDDTPWLSEDEAVQYVLDKHFALFYQPERIKVDPPKGVYTFVAQCGLSGKILGPPNYHDYQTQLRKLHAERFSHMPFEAYKARVKIVRDEEVVKRWLEEQSYKTKYICLNLPEPLELHSREEVEKHFREVHMANIIQQVETVRVKGNQARSLPCKELARLVRHVWEEQKRFPLQVATVLSQMFAARGLQFFKVNRTITHVAVARPHYLDLESAPVSEGVRRIVEYINAHPKCTRRDLIEALAPSPKPETPPQPAAPQATAEQPAAEQPQQAESEATSPAAEAQPTTETGQPAATATEAPAATAPTEAQPQAQAETAPAAQAPQPTQPAAPEPTPEQTAVIADLHWLIHQGHVIEFANGVLETAKKPAPKPAKQEKPKEEKEKAKEQPAAAEQPAEAKPAGSEAKAEEVSKTEGEAKPAEAASVQTAQATESQQVSPVEPPRTASGASPEGVPPAAQPGAEATVSEPASGEASSPAETAATSTEAQPAPGLDQQTERPAESEVTPKPETASETSTSASSGPASPSSEPAAASESASATPQTKPISTEPPATSTAAAEPAQEPAAKPEDSQSEPGRSQGS